MQKSTIPNTKSELKLAPIPQEKNQNTGSKACYSRNSYHNYNNNGYSHKHSNHQMPRSYQRTAHNQQKTRNNEKYSYFYAKNKFLVKNCCEDLLTDPSFQIPWADIDSVIVESTEQFTCPICLDAPIVPRTDVCGHIYCYHCLMQYFSSLKSPQKAKCTVCTHEIEISCVKRAIIYHKDDIKVGSELDFVKVTRFPNNIVIYDSPQEDQFKPNWDMTRFKLSSKKFLNKVIQDEMNDVKNMITIFQMEAIALETVPFLRNVSNKLKEEINLIKHRSQEQEPVIETLGTNQNFFIDSNKRDVYIDSFCWKLISSHYSSLNKDIPDKLTLQIEAINRQTMDSLLRKRYKHLAHLPDGREFVFVEVKLEGVVKPEILEAFKDTLDKRMSIRLKKAEEDRILELKKQEEENKLPHLPVGFTLKGPTKLDLDNDFLPLSVTNPVTSSSNSQNSPVSFASITKKGSLNVVDNKRIAKWTKEKSNVIRNDVKISDFNWPSLSNNK